MYSAVNLPELSDLMDIKCNEGRILLSCSSQGESSVMRVRLEGHKNPLQIYALAHYKYVLAHYEYTLGGSDV